MSEDEKLILLPLHEYIGVDRDDPIRQYQKPLFGKYYKKRVELCLQECRAGEKVLEIGFGTGVTFFNLAKKYKEIHGIDLKSNTQAITGMFASKGLKVFLKQGNILDLPYEDASFDTVLLISILEHLQPANLDQAFSEMHRVLKPFGQLVYGVPSDNTISRFGFLMLGYNIKHHHFSSPIQINQAAEKWFVQENHVPLLLPLIKAKVYEIGCFIKK